jgi:nitroreductase
MIDHAAYTKAIHRSQHCQRNWDLSKQISQKDLKLLEIAATQCPSKQNHSFYALKFITDRALIEKIHETTNGFGVKDNPDLPASKENTAYHTNSQTLANLLIIIEYAEPSERLKWRNETYNNKWKKDADMSIGIAAGYLNLIGTLLGYQTGCCACYNNKDVQKLVNTKNDIALMMGIGFKDNSRPRREHHTETEFTFPTKKKEEIKVEYL